MPGDWKADADISLARLSGRRGGIPEDVGAEAAGRVLSRLTTPRTVVRAVDLETVDTFLEGISEPDIAIFVASLGSIEVLDDAGTLIFARDDYPDDIALDPMFEARFRSGLKTVNEAGRAILASVMGGEGGEGAKPLAGLAGEWGQDEDDLLEELHLALAEVDRGGRGIVTELSTLVCEAIDQGDDPERLRERAASLSWASAELIRALDGFARAEASVPKVTPREWRRVGRASTTASTPASEREAIKRVRQTADALAAKRPTKADNALVKFLTKPMTIKQVAGNARIATAEAMQALIRLEAAGAVVAQPGVKPIRYMRAGG